MVTVPLPVVSMYLPAAPRKELHIEGDKCSICSLSVLSCVFCIVCRVQLFEFFNCCQVLRGRAKKAASFHVFQVTSRQLSSWKLWLSVHKAVDTKNQKTTKKIA